MNNFVFISLTNKKLVNKQKSIENIFMYAIIFRNNNNNSKNNKGRSKIAAKFTFFKNLSY